MSTNFVDVKCPVCGHLGMYYNIFCLKGCSICRATFSVRVKDADCVKCNFRAQCLLYPQVEAFRETPSDSPEYAAYLKKLKQEVVLS